MSLVLNEEQVFLKDSAKKFASEKTPTTHFREVRDSEIENCYDDKVWQEMVSLGWTGILVPEEFGGSNFGVAGISSILFLQNLIFFETKSATAVFFWPSRAGPTFFAHSFQP